MIVIPVKTPTEYRLRVFDLNKPRNTECDGPRYALVDGKAIGVGGTITFGARGRLFVPSEYGFVDEIQGIFTLRKEDQGSFPGVVYNDFGGARILPVFKFDDIRGREINLRNDDPTRIYAGESFRILDNFGREALEVAVDLPLAGPSGSRVVEVNL